MTLTEHLGPGGRLRYAGGQGRRHRLGHHRRPPGRRPRRHVGAARRDRGRRRHPQALRHRLAEGLRLLPDVPGRGRRRARRPRVVHDAVQRRHGRQHPDRHRPRPAPQRDGALPLRPPRGLRRLRPRQLRDPGARRAGRRRRGPLRPTRDARRRRPPAADRPEQPVLRLRRLRLHRLLPLRARLRRHPGHLRAHGRGPRLRLQDQRRRHRLHVVGVRLVRRLRPGLPDVRAAGEVDRRARHADALGRHHLRLLRRRLLVPRRGPGRRATTPASSG